VARGSRHGGRKGIEKEDLCTVSGVRERAVVIDERERLRIVTIRESDRAPLGEVDGYQGECIYQGGSVTGRAGSVRCVPETGESSYGDVVCVRGSRCSGGTFGKSERALSACGEGRTLRRRRAMAK